MGKLLLKALSLLALTFFIPAAYAITPVFSDSFEEAKGLVLINEDNIGVLLSEDGWVLSAGNYGDEGDTVDVCFFFEDTLGYECTYSGLGIVYHDDADLILYKIEDFNASDEGMVPYEFSEELLNTGDEVLVIGVNEFGNHVEESQTVTGVANTFSVDWVNDNWLSTELDAPWFYTVSGYGENEVKHGPVFLDGHLVGFSNVEYGSKQDITKIISSPLIRWSLSHRAESDNMPEDFIDENYVGLNFNNTVQFFADVNWDDSLANELAFLRTNDVVDGYSDGYFRESNPINRAELLKMLVESRVGSIATSHSNCFTDVGTEWFAKYVCYAESEGWVEGYSDGSFQPAKNINRAEALAMIFKVYASKIELDDIEEGDAPVCLDVPNSSWYADYVYTADKEEIVSCDAVAYFYPANEITRGDVSLYLYRLLVGSIQEVLE